MRHFLSWICLILVMGSVRLQAQTTITWYSLANSTNKNGAGGDMDAGFQFQLGVFTAGFVPGPSNMTQWASNWNSPPGATTAYNQTTKSFTSDFLVTSNATPYTYGAKAYIWGRKTTSTGSEWILFRNNGWTWPAPDPTGMSPFNLNWSASTANEVILGTIHSNGSPFLMKSETIETYDQWKISKLTGEPLNGPNHDPDRDGVSNLLEFAFGSAPLQAGAPPATPAVLVAVSGQKYLQITLPRLRNRLATIVVQVSGDLVHWNSGTSYTVEISNTPDSLIVRDLTPVGPGIPRRFMRVKSEISP